jgi:hypothetical protein
LMWMALTLRRSSVPGTADCSFSTSGNKGPSDQVRSRLTSHAASVNVRRFPPDSVPIVAQFVTQRHGPGSSRVVNSIIDKTIAS